ncbi:MAG TPA: ABC transporter permease [Bryobacteraceae bacterium]|nr:ABC transporter permease [Bryobacteraceae bacterium]
MTRRTKIRAAVLWLLVWHAAILLAGFIAPYPYDEQHRDYPLAPPSTLRISGTRLMVIDPAGALHPVDFFTRGRLFGVEQRGVIFLWGSDGLGRDIFSRVLYGGQISLLTGMAATVLALGLGLLFGIGSGYFGGWPDHLIMRLGELALAVPWFYLLLAARAFLPLHIGPPDALLLLVGIIGAVGWVRPARLVRGVALSAREQPFLLAARGFGASHAYLIRRHLLPLTRPVLLTQATVLIPQFILAEVGLSFLGLGIGQPVPSWGNMLAEARQYHVMVAHPWLLAPGLAAIPVLLGYLILADALLEKNN